MIRILFCVAAALGAIIHVSASAAPLEFSPNGVAYRNDVPALHYVQLERGRPAAPPSQKRLQPAPLYPAKVYLLRGFMNVFSLGMDDLAEQIRANGIAATVTNHADIDLIVPQIVSRYQAGDHGAIVLIGHSLGADAVIDMAQALDRYGVPVAAAILFDGTAPHTVPGNVATAVNFTLRFSIAPAADFHGTLSNVDLQGDQSVDHLNIDKTPQLQAQALGYVLRAAAAPPASAPAARRP
jgi:hypothetical protein